MIHVTLLVFVHVESALGSEVETVKRCRFCFKVNDMDEGWDFVMLNLDPEMWMKDLHQQWTARMGGRGSAIFDVVGVNETVLWESFHTKSVTVGF